jgi:transcriptional regulator with PAS, ATPase and Fis domain
MELIPEWIEHFPGPITICDQDGWIVYMNQSSVGAFRNSGGAGLIGSNLLDCHPEPSMSKLKDLLNSPQENIYTIEKDGVKKIIMQIPWFSDDRFKGLVEISKVIPSEMPHFLRK